MTFPPPGLPQRAPPVIRAPQPAAPSRRFPSLDFGGGPVQASAHVADGTGLWSAVGWTVVGLGFLFGTLLTTGILLVLLLIGAVAAWFQAKKTRALLNGQGVRVQADQLPELHACVESFASRLGLTHVPETYVLEDGALNAFAMKLAGRHTLLLTDDAVWGALQSKNPQSLGFLVAHELAHFALGHTGWFRATVRASFPPLKRLDELSADNVALALVGDTQVAFDGIKLLITGPQLSHFINDDALRAQAEEVVAARISKKAERAMSHPLNLRRLHNVLR